MSAAVDDTPILWAPTVAEIDAEIAATRQRLKRFRFDVITIAKREQEAHEWCSEVWDVMRSLGLVRGVHDRLDGDGPIEVPPGYSRYEVRFAFSPLPVMEIAAADRYDARYRALSQAHLLGPKVRVRDVRLVA